MKEAVAFAGGGARRLSAREEELLALLAGIPDGGGDSDRELSFSDLVVVEAGARQPSADLGAPAALLLDDRRTTAAASKQQRQQAARQRAARRSGGSRGSCGGAGDGVLLNFYVPGLLTRSMTTPRPTPTRGPPPPPGAVVQGGAPPAKPVRATSAFGAGKASRRQAALGIGCWPALWGRGRRTAKSCI